MSNIDITKKDISWSYIAKFFQIGSGFITLPLVLRMLTPEEIGMNYLMLTISSMVALLDFGFGPQFGRNFTYVNSGARRLLKEGIEYNDNDSGNIDYHLLSVLLKTAKYVYQRLSLFSLLIMLTFGTLYIYHITNGFNNVNNSLIIWILFSISTYFSINFSFYNSLLTGSGKVAEANIGTILSQGIYLISVTVFLLSGFGLIGTIIGTFISLVVKLTYCHKKYYTPTIRKNIIKKVDKKEIKETFDILWFNAKKLGINFLGSFAINKSAMFIIGFFLPLSVVGSYGLMIQFGTILIGIAQTLFNTYIPLFNNLRIVNNKIKIKQLICFTTLVYLIIMVLGSLSIIFIAPYILKLLNAITTLPATIVMIIYFVSLTLEGNHSNFATLIVSNNQIPFVKSCLLSGFFILLFTILVLKFTNLQILGIVIVQSIVQLSYNNWRWPLWIIKEFDINIKDFLTYSMLFIKNK